MCTSKEYVSTWNLCRLGALSTHYYYSFSSSSFHPSSSVHFYTTDRNAPYLLKCHLCAVDTGCYLWVRLWLPSGLCGRPTEFRCLGHAEDTGGLQGQVSVHAVTLLPCSPRLLKELALSKPASSSVLQYVLRDHKDYKGQGAQDGHLDFHTDSKLWACFMVE